jgi:DNA-binding NarL/FixJ family response regulator
MHKAPVFLLVESSPFLRPVLSGWLEDVLDDSRILIAVNGEEALKLVASERPSYVLVAINMHDRTDIELIRQLRHAIPEARIIATSWFENRWLLKSVMSAGADGFLTKERLYSELLPLWDVLPKL